jgi:hypothetical protein
MSTDENCKSLTFLSSPTVPQLTDPKQPQYHFKSLDGGEFKPHTKYGSVSLSHFCFTAIAGYIKGWLEHKPQKQYGFQVYEERGNKHTVIFSAFLDSCLYPCMAKDRVKATFPGMSPEPICARKIEIVGDELKLDWLSNTGWEIVSSVTPCVV